jgi:transcriptional regulator with XRE-family HTH domain
MGTKETRKQRGQRRGAEIATAAVRTLREARVSAGVSQAELAREAGWSQSFTSLLERSRVPEASFLDLCIAASVLGLEPSLTFHRVGPAIRDKGHEALIGRLMHLLSPAWHVAREVPFPNTGDPRWWDLLLRLPDYRLGVEAETRIRDMQAMVRRMKERAREGRADALLLILSDSAHNRELVDELRGALGDDFRSHPRDVLAALRSGSPLVGPGVVLL